MGRDHYHDKGEKDYKAGRYEKPNGALSSLITWSDSKMRSNRDENARYDKGYSNARRQDKRR